MKGVMYHPMLKSAVIDRIRRGEKVWRVSAQTGIPERTIYDWMREYKQKEVTA